MNHIEPSTIRDIGTILSVDSFGYIVSQSSKDKITSPWNLIVDDITEAYNSHIPDQVHSIYIKGSVGRGESILGVSDLDCLVLLKNSDNNVDTEWIGSLKKELTFKYPFCTDFDIVRKNVEDILSGKNKIAPVLLKIMSVCVYWEDIIPSLPSVKPWKGSLICSWGFKKFIEDKIVLLSDFDYPGNVGLQCKWVMKRILRTWFELVMEREECFTRDLYPCYKLFSKYYPEKEQEMKEVLSLAINNTNDQKIVLNLLRNIWEWTVDEVEKIYGVR